MVPFIQWLRPKYLVLATVPLMGHGDWVTCSGVSCSWSWVSPTVKTRARDSLSSRRWTGSGSASQSSPLGASESESEMGAEAEAEAEASRITELGADTPDVDAAGFFLPLLVAVVVAAVVAAVLLSPARGAGAMRAGRAAAVDVLWPFLAHDAGIWVGA